MLTQTKVHGLEEATELTVIRRPEPARPEARGTALFLALGTAALWFLNTSAFRYLTIEQDIYGIYWSRRGWVLAHVLAGTVALMLGPINLWLGLNRRRSIIHRVLGILYVVSVAAASVAAFKLALKTDFGWVFGIGLTCMAIAWVMTTAFATVSICRKMIDEHRQWMIRSYIVTFGFVLFRLTVDVLETAHIGTMTERLTAASWLCWTVPLLIAEGVLQGRKVLGRRRMPQRVEHNLGY